jgi:RNA polymerase sigma factor (sigma-70 family)
MQIRIELIKSCIACERKAQFELYKSCYGLLMSICYRYEKNKEDAEEMVNMAFLKILKNIQHYQQKVPFEAWIRKIMINTIIDRYRTNKRMNETMLNTDFSESKHHNNSYDLNEADLAYNAESLENLLLHLPEMSRKVFNLYAIDGFSHKEISDMLGISEGTSKWHVSTSRVKLKDLLIQLNNSLNNAKIAI